MATYYTSSSAGGGGVGSIGDEWTLQEAADGVAGAGGDLVLVKADGTYNETSTIDFDTNAGAIENPNIFRGANSDGTDDGTVATVNGSGIGAAPLFNLNVASMYTHFENLRLTAGTTYNISLGTGLNISSLIFKNVRIDNATTAGVYAQESSTGMIVEMINCEIDNNTGDGVDSVGLSRGGYKMINTSIHDNGGDGIEESAQSEGKSMFIGCLFYDNGGHGLNIVSGLRNGVIISCIFFGNTGNGIEMILTSPINDLLITNCIFRSNGGYGIDTNGGSLLQFAFADFNCYSNNTSGHIDINGGTPPGANNILDNPDFTSEVDGSEDFTLQSVSPCLDVGFGYNG